MKSVISLILFLCSIRSFVISREWIDTSDMTDSRLLRNRHRHSSYEDNSNTHKIIYKETKVVFQSDPKQLKDEYKPRNPFPNTDICLDESLQIDDANKLEDMSEYRKCVSNRLKSNNQLEDKNRITQDASSENDEMIQANQIEPINQQCSANNQHNQKNLNRIASHLEITYFAPSNQVPQKNEKTNNSEMLNSCLLKNKELTEDLICFRNLKSLYVRYFTKINQVIQLMSEQSQKIELHPYSNEFLILFNVLKHENCLSAVDDLEKIISKLDRFLYRIEPVDYTKELIYATFGFSILFSFIYIYKYLRVKYLIYSLLFFFAYAHEYYYLILAKKSEIANEMKKLNRCQEQGLFTGLLSYFLAGFYSPFSFKGDQCEINEDYFYIDAVFKINPLMPIFTILPKLFTKTLIILFENSAIAFRKFSSQLPIFHVYPILILFLCLLFFLTKIVLDWRVEVRKVDQKGRLKLEKLKEKLKITASKSDNTSEIDLRPSTSRTVSINSDNIRSNSERPHNMMSDDLRSSDPLNMIIATKSLDTNQSFANKLRRTTSVDSFFGISDFNNR